ncbi:MAG: dTMP kinase [Blastocatellia bacterium]|nr:dTMP kinase [Blastocatellia bacterium]
MAGVFITFEGIDGSGKSTQMRLLAGALREQGLAVLTTREPGGTPLGQRLRAALLDVDELVDPLAELLVFAADRAQHVRTVLRPAVAAGHVVFSDRYADATVAYQGAGRGFEKKLIDEIVTLATDGLKPDLTLIFDLPVAECVARTRRRHESKNTGDRIDSENIEFHTRVREGYLRIAAAEPERVRVIEATGATQETHQKVSDIVIACLKERGLISPTLVKGV